MTICLSSDYTCTVFILYNLIIYSKYTTHHLIERMREKTKIISHFSMVLSRRVLWRGVWEDWPNGVVLIARARIVVHEARGSVPTSMMMTIFCESWNENVRPEEEEDSWFPRDRHWAPMCLCCFRGEIRISLWHSDLAGCLRCLPGGDDERTP